MICLGVGFFTTEEAATLHSYFSEVTLFIIMNLRFFCGIEFNYIFFQIMNFLSSLFHFFCFPHLISAVVLLLWIGKVALLL